MNTDKYIKNNKHIRVLLNNASRKIATVIATLVFVKILQKEFVSFRRKKKTSKPMYLHFFKS